MTAPAPATVYLVGAGPGDPGLITMRGVECLERADVVLVDYLVNPVLAEHAAPAAEVVRLGVPGDGRALTQDEIIGRMIDAARAGKTVTRLKGGDPSVFGRGAEETAALHEAGVPYEIVPGITTGLAVAAYAEIPITHRDDASAVALVVGRERDGRTDSHLDYGALAAFPGTLVLYMGVKRVAEWSEALVEHGKPPDTPVAIVRWCSRAEQESYTCTLGTVAEFVQERTLAAPVIFVVGPVVDRAPVRSWFAARPLFGTRVLVTGSQGTSVRLRTQLHELGADVVMQPVIQITDPPDWSAVDAALDGIADYDWLVFASANGVDYLVERLVARGGDLRQFGGVRVAALGTGTADCLLRHGLRADLVPEKFVADTLAEELTDDAANRRFLVARTNRGRRVLAEALRAAGAEVDEVVVYGSVDVEQPDPAVIEALGAGKIDWITVASSATARALHRLYADSLAGVRLVSIGPMTSATLRELGLPPAVEAAPHTSAGLVEAILRKGKK